MQHEASRCLWFIAYNWIWFELSCIHGWEEILLSAACKVKLCQRTSIALLICPNLQPDILSYDQKARASFRSSPQDLHCWLLKNQHDVEKNEVSQSLVMQLKNIYQPLPWEKKRWTKYTDIKVILHLIDWEKMCIIVHLEFRRYKFLK